MGNQHSSLHQEQETADDLYYKESTKKGLKAISAFGASILFAPAVMLALPLIGAYEFSSAVQDELITGHSIMDGVIGGLFGVIVSPLAPFYCFLISIQEIFDSNNLSRKKKRLDVDYLKRASGMLHLDYSYYNVVITGSPGTGKSSLLNGLLGYKESNKRAAEIGEIETTLEPKSYRHPILNTLYLWDMPGIGTPRHPSKDFFDNYCLGAFDAILIVFDDRFMASDIDIARRAKKFHVPVFFVKNKADIAIEKKMERMKPDLTEDDKWATAVSQLTLEIKNTIYKNMQQFYLDTNHLYIISSNALQDFVIFLKENAGHHSYAKAINKRQQQRIIHEKVLITNLLDTLVERRNEKKVAPVSVVYT